MSSNNTETWRTSMNAIEADLEFIKLVEEIAADVIADTRD